MKKVNQIELWRALATLGLILALLLGFSLGADAQNAATLLDKAATQYTQSNGIKAIFTLQTSGAGGSDRMEGTIQMRGDKFRLELPGTITWFDGQTQWSYVEHNEEVNVTTPTAEELPFTNPALLLRTYKKGFTAVYKGESTAANGKMAYDIELTPKKKSDLTKVVLQLEKNSGLPIRMVVSAKNGTNSIVQISQLQTNQNQSDCFFVFNETDYPDAEVIDLR